MAKVFICHKAGSSPFAGEVTITNMPTSPNNMEAIIKILLAIFCKSFMFIIILHVVSTYPWSKSECFSIYKILAHATIDT